MKYYNKCRYSGRHSRLNCFICDGQRKAAANRLSMHYKYVRRHNGAPLFILYLRDPHTAPKHMNSENTGAFQKIRML
jgi:hypothetical protein